MYHGEEFIKPAEERYNNVAKGVAPDQIKTVNLNQDEMNILNGSRKNSGKNSVISDKRTVRMDDFLTNRSSKVKFALPSFRNWI